MLFNICHVMLNDIEQNRTCYITCVVLCYITYVQNRTCYVI